MEQPVKLDTVRFSMTSTLRERVEETIRVVEGPGAYGIPVDRDGPENDFADWPDCARGLHDALNLLMGEIGTDYRWNDNLEEVQMTPAAQWTWDQTVTMLTAIIRSERFGGDGTYSTFIKNGRLARVLHRILELSDTEASGEMVLGLTGGVGAVDQQTAHLAAGKLREMGYETTLPRGWNRNPDAMFAELAEVEVDERTGSVKATIDTGVMRWDGEPEECAFTGYDGREYKGVELSKQEFIEGDGVILVRATMRMGEGKTVDAWFAEIDEQRDEIDALELMQTARMWACQWDMREGERQKADVLSVPAQDFRCEASLPYVGVLRDGVDVGAQVEQRFAVALDEKGARAIAQTVVMLGVLDVDREPVVRRLGERGPVVMWFGKSTWSYPFAVAYTDARAWLAPGTEVDLEGLELEV